MKMRRMMRRRSDGIEVLAGVTQEALACRPGPLANRHDALVERREEVLQGRAVKGFLVVKVVIEQRLVDARSFGDGIDAGPGQAFLGELGQSGA